MKPLCSHCKQPILTVGLEPWLEAGARVFCSKECSEAYAQWERSYYP